MANKKSVSGQHRHLDAVRQNHVTEPFWLQLGPVVFLTVLFLINFIARIILSPLLPTIEKELGISHGEAGSFFFLISAGYVIALLGSGFLASRSSHRITIVISSAGVGFALLGISMTSSLWAMRMGLFILGFAAGLYTRPSHPDEAARHACHKGQVHRANACEAGQQAAEVRRIIGG